MKNTTYLIDSFAFIEFLEGNDIGRRVLDLLSDEANDILISAISIYEIGIVVERNHGKSKMMEVVRSLTSGFHIMDITTETSLLAIELKREYKLPTADCLIYASAKETGAKVVSGCKHFKGIKEQVDVMII